MKKETLSLLTIIALCVALVIRALPATHAQTEPDLPQDQVQAVSATPAPPQLTVEQAMQNLGGVLNAWIVYAPTNDAQRKLAAESYNTVKAALDRLAVLEAPPKPEETKK